MYKLSFNHKLPDSGKRECQRRYMHLGFDRPPPPSLCGSLQGPSIINRCQADFELVTQPGPFCAASGLETPAQENSPIPSPLLAQKKSLGAFRGGVVRASPRAPARVTVSPEAPNQGAHLI